MSYEESIEWFWGRVQALRLDGYQIAMWFGLLKLFKDAGFPTRCEVENESLCNLLGINIKTVIAVRKRLIENNLIAYEAGNAKKQPAYIIDMELYASMHPVKKIVKPQLQVKSKPKPKRVQEVVEPVLFKEDKKKRLPKKVEQASPTLEEVVKICTEKGMSEDEARNFFYYYDAQGWVTTGGQKIKRIDSMVNRWLTNGKGKEHDRVNNTNTSKREARNREVIEHVMSHYK